MSDTMLRRLSVPLLLASLAVTQSGCFTLLAATACVAGGSDPACGDVVTAAAAVDAVLIEGATRHSADERRFDDCIGESFPCEDDPTCCCYE